MRRSLALSVVVDGAGDGGGVCGWSLAWWVVVEAEAGVVRVFLFGLYDTYCNNSVSGAVICGSGRWGGVFAVVLLGVVFTGDGVGG